MRAGIKYFRPGVERAGIRIVHNMPLLLQTQSADPGDRVEDPAPVNDLPVQGVRYSWITKFERPDVSRKFCAFHLLRIPLRSSVSVPSSFEASCYAPIGLTGVDISPSHRTTVHTILPIY